MDFVKKTKKNGCNVEFIFSFRNRDVGWLKKDKVRDVIFRCVDAKENKIRCRVQFQDESAHALWSLATDTFRYIYIFYSFFSFLQHSVVLWSVVNGIWGSCRCCKSSESTFSRTRDPFARRDVNKFVEALR